MRLGAAGLIALLVLALGSTSTRSGWTTAAVTNSADRVATGALAFTHAYGARTCSSVARVAGTVVCTGTIAPSDSITNNGTLAGTKLQSELSAASCAPVKLADAATASDPMLPRYDTSFQQADPWGGSNAITLANSRSYAADVVQVPVALQTSLTIGVWFKVPSGYASGGGLISLDSSSTDATSAAGSPMLWMDNAGKIRYRVTGAAGGSGFGVSAASYNDGAWHFAMLSFGTLTGTLYVDNTSVSGTAVVTLASSGGYWHLGWVDATGVVNAPTTPYLNGSLAGAFVRSVTTSAAQEANLFAATSSADFKSRLTALGSVNHLWLLDDTGTTTYTGTLPVLGSTSPCSMLDIAWTVANPAGTVTTSTKLSTFANGSWHAVPAPDAGQTQSSTITTSRDATYNAYVNGLRLYAPLAHRVQTLPTPSSWSQTFSWADASMVFVP
ncbi:MAG: hypothetical protein J7518_21225 [Nocardioidaceae bacterium]|nr:hypothetical protein [Nocardioidaceae bacterium]